MSFFKKFAELGMPYERQVRVQNQCKIPLNLGVFSYSPRQARDSVRVR
jgi:hypothetical protein